VAVELFVEVVYLRVKRVEMEEVDLQLVAAVVEEYYALVEEHKLDSKVELLASCFALAVLLVMGKQHCSDEPCLQEPQESSEY